LTILGGNKYKFIRNKGIKSGGESRRY
jgi:hypothetical protein